MKELHKLDNYDFDTLKSFINNGIEESQYIEFKSGEALSKKDAHKKEISKDVSAFANSDGGIIIYGISEKNHKADSFSFIDGNEFNKEWLEQIISSNINRSIPNLKIFPIRKNGNIKETIYVVQIPSSTEAPHMCREKRFYRRALFECAIMEEYEIRQLYGRKVKSELFLRGFLISPVKSDNDDTYKFQLETGIVNEGEKIEKDYKINVNFTKIEEFFNISWSPNNLNKNNNYTRLNDKVVVSANGTSPIYPNETIDFLRFEFEISKRNILTSIENLKIEFKLLYPNGEDTFESDLTYFIDKLEEIDKRLLK